MGQHVIILIYSLILVNTAEKNNLQVFSIKNIFGKFMTYANRLVLIIIVVSLNAN